MARVELPPLTPETGRSCVDRNGVLLRPFAISDGRWRLPVTLADVDPLFVKTLIAYEDRRFREHRGVDVKALFRAALQFVAARAPRLGRLDHHHAGGAPPLGAIDARRSAARFRQMLMALALEQRLSKDEILDLYLTLAPYGGNIEGIRAASLAYLGKEPRRLTPARGGAARRAAAGAGGAPPRPQRRARRKRRATACSRAPRGRRLYRRGRMRSGAVGGDAGRAPCLPDARAARRRSRDRRGARASRSHRLTIDAGFQARLKSLASERAAALSDSVSVAILVADHQTGEILASVGSSGLFDERRDGFIDMTRAVRSPGSTLKPLIYGLAFELGIAHPETLIEDKPVDFAGYPPENFDREFHGTVSVRRALQLSLNVPAIELLEAVGPARLVARMRRAGAAPVLPDLSPPGLAVGLGGVGVTLTDLVAIHAAIARGGMAVPLTHRRGRAR